MKLRPQFNLRFENEDQFLIVKGVARVLKISINQWIVNQVKNGLGEQSKPTLKELLMPATKFVSSPPPDNPTRVRLETDAVGATGCKVTIGKSIAR